ncbi:hypothetical protein EJA03_13795 [Vibrio pectenicida]|uniref:Uncharacterized protein n=1 Tax=Vibrio pectenicida TaxID=62763 RepID=A0A3R9F5N5_9VIBR|nr:hypothetical protein EJA03_13795 [Vibrio pectenicida]
MDSEGMEALAVSKSNVSTIVWATLCLEQKMERVLTDFFFGKFCGFDPKRHLFEKELLESSAMQFSFKKKLVQKVCVEHQGLSGKKSSKLQGALKRVMEVRNAFAHGQMTLDAKDGVVLNFYSGEHKKFRLNEKFWLNVEADFQTAEELLSEIIT